MPSRTDAPFDQDIHALTDSDQVSALSRHRSDFLAPFMRIAETLAMRMAYWRSVLRRTVASMMAVQRRRPVAFLGLSLLGLLSVPALSPSLGFATSVAGVPLFDGVSTPAREVVSTSRYVHWMTPDVTADRAFADRLGCESAKRGESGPLVLAFGRQVEGGGTRGFDGRPARYGYEHLGAVASGFRDGLARCGGDALVVVATSNYRLDDPVEAAAFGAEWSALIRSIGDRDGVRVVGGTDLEPGWGSLAGARAWVQSFKSSGLTLYSNASADGCPLKGHGGPCANGWNTSALAELVWAEGGVAIPQIYRHDGAQADQWGVLARLWADSGQTVRFGGAMTQVRACDQVRNANCPQLSLDPSGAREKLQAAVGEVADVPVGTDIGWG